MALRDAICIRSIFAIALTANNPYLPDREIDSDCKFWKCQRRNLLAPPKPEH
jgi:hypothetical protein